MTAGSRPPHRGTLISGGRVGGGAKTHTNLPADRPGHRACGAGHRAAASSKRSAAQRPDHLPRGQLGWPLVFDLGWETGPKLHGLQKVRAMSSPVADPAPASVRPNPPPKQPSPPRTYGEFAAAELTRLRRRADSKAGKGRRRVGARGRPKGLLMARARSPPVQHSSKQRRRSGSLARRRASICMATHRW